MQKKNEKKFTHGEHVTIYPDAPESVASATECTGLMPTPPQNEAEFTSYQDLHSMEIPKKLPSASGTSSLACTTISRKIFSYKKSASSVGFGAMRLVTF